MLDLKRLRDTNWYMRITPAVLLSALYLVIAYSKIVRTSRDITSGVNDAGWLADTLSAVHSVSGAIFFAILGVVMLVRKEPVRRERRIIGWIMPVVVTVSFAVVGGAPLQHHPDGVMLVATFLVVVGTAFTIYALKHLGRHFGVVSDVRGLVTSGPYRWARHPLYAGETITIIGLVLAVATPFTVVVFLVGLGLQVWRARIEEQSLSAAFPEYSEYAARTPMLIPFMRLTPRVLPVTPDIKHQH